MKSSNCISRNLVFAFLFLTPLASYPTSAAAENSSESAGKTTVVSNKHGPGLTVWGILAQRIPHAGLGLGVHYQMPVIDGILGDAGLDDQFFFEFGVDFSGFVNTNNDPYLRIRPAIGFLWTIWLTDEFAIYPKMDMGLPLFFGHPHNEWWPLLGTFGILYELTNFHLRVEGGWYGVNIGARFSF